MKNKLMLFALLSGILLSGQVVSAKGITLDKLNKTKIVKPEEIKILENRIIANTSFETSQSTTYPCTAQLKIKNTGDYTVDTIIISGKINDTVVTFIGNKLKSKDSTTLQVQENLADLSATKVELNAIVVTSNKTKVTYQLSDGKTTYDYAEPDKTKPVISGFVGKKSYNRDWHNKIMPYRVVYSNQRNSFDYTKYVKAKDNRPGKIELTADTSKINFDKAGIYNITFIAKDKAGNIAKAKAKIQVRKEKTLDKACDTILYQRIGIKKSWSTKKKAIRIYNYTRGHIHYTGHSDKSSWEKDALHGIRFGNGDCFTYYAVARALLTRAGIPNIEVNRVRGAGHHWWCMVYVKGGWYHYDCGPRVGGGRFCLVTDKQLRRFSRNYYKDAYIWAYKKKPKSAKKRISWVKSGIY